MSLDRVTLLRYVDAASRATERAARAAAAAERHEATLRGVSGALRSFLEARAALQRRTQERHLRVADLYRLRASFLRERLEKPPGDVGVEPRFIDAVASVASSASVCVDFKTAVSTDVAVASNHTAQAAHDCETVLGVGPAHACYIDGPLLVGANELRSRWAPYAAVVEPLGVQEVAAIPLRVRDVTVGSMSALGTSIEPIRRELSDLCTVGDALVDVLVSEMDDPALKASGLIESLDVRDVLHQAAGIVSTQYGCQISDALGLLRAHAFSSGSDLHSTASAVVSGELRFDP